MVNACALGCCARCRVATRGREPWPRVRARVRARARVSGCPRAERLAPVSDSSSLRPGVTLCPGAKGGVVSGVGGRVAGCFCWCRVLCHGGSCCFQKSAGVMGPGYSIVGGGAS